MVHGPIEHASRQRHNRADISVRMLEQAPGAPLSTGTDSESRSAIGSDVRRVLLCAACRNVVTGLEQRIVVSGSHRHTFANPHGMIYRIGCFAAAAGCKPWGEASWQFTWFAGYAWTVEQCLRCDAHLGWQFSSGLHTFHGLVYDRLAEPTEPPAAGS